MANRYELKTARQGNDGKTYWTRIGSMFPMKGKNGFNLVFDALPIPSQNDQGQMEVRVTAWEPLPKGGQPDAHNQAKGNGYQPDQDRIQHAMNNPGGANLDAEIPF